MPLQKKPFQFSLFAFKIALFITLFLVGGLFAKKDWPPFESLINGYRATKTLVEEMTRTRPVVLNENVYSGDGVVMHDPQQASKGLTVLQGILPGGAQLRLIDMDGKPLHTWPVDFFKIWPKPSHLLKQNIPKTPFDYHTMGNMVLPDGSVIVNFVYLGTAKLDRCGKVLWTVDRMTHHFVIPTQDGNYWIAAHHAIDEIADELLFFNIKRTWLKEVELQNYEDILLLVSPVWI